MLVCNVSLRPRRAGISATLEEVISATDATATGNVVFATLVDDPTSVFDRVDAVSGELMLEAANANAAVNAGLAYSAGIVAAVTTLDSVSATVTAAPAGDTYWSNVKFLAGFEGADTSTGAPGMTDESLVASGTGTATSVRISTAQFKFGTSSLQCIAGNLQYANNANHALGSAPFTIELWVYPTSLSGTPVIVGKCGNGSPNLGWLLYINSSVLTLLGSSTGTSAVTVVSGGTLVTGSWQHVCVDFNGTKYRMYKNGVMAGSSTTLVSFFNPAKSLTFGATADNANLFGGYIDEARLTVGTARYASDSGFTVATSAFPRS